MTPVCWSASTRTKRPATSGKTLHDTPVTTGQGDWRVPIRMKAAVAAPAAKVGRPRRQPSAEAARSASAVAAIPIAASAPPRVSGAGSGAAFSAVVSCRRRAKRRARKVSAIETVDGKAKRASQTRSGGMFGPKTTRLAGLEIGRTKLAALSMKAQIKRYGSGSAPAARAAAYTAGVSTTAVASLERKVVTITPTP